MIFSYIRADCMTDLKVKFTQVVEAVPIRDLQGLGIDITPFKDGFRYNQTNLFVDYTLYTKNGNKANWQKLMDTVNAGDVIYISSLGNVFDNAEEFVEVMFDLNERKVYLYAAEEKFANTLFNYEVTLKLLSILSNLQMPPSSVPPHNVVDYPEDFVALYQQLKSRQKTANEIAQECGISVPTLHRLVLFFER